MMHHALYYGGMYNMFTNITEEAAEQPLEYETLFTPAYSDRMLSPISEEVSSQNVTTPSVVEAVKPKTSTIAEDKCSTTSCSLKSCLSMCVIL